MEPSQLFFSFSDREVWSNLFNQYSSATCIDFVHSIISQITSSLCLPMLFSDSLYLILLFQHELKVNTLGMYFFLWTDYSGTWARYFFEFFLLLISKLFILENLRLFSTLKLVGLNLVVVHRSEKGFVIFLLPLMFADCSMITLTLIICANYTLIIFFPLLKEISHCHIVFMLFSRNQLNTHALCFTLY